jgi:hypothetical protein
LHTGKATKQFKKTCFKKKHQIAPNLWLFLPLLEMTAAKVFLNGRSITRGSCHRLSVLFVELLIWKKTKLFVFPLIVNSY